MLRPILKAAAEKLERTFGYTLVMPPAYNFPRVGVDKCVCVCL